jgi:hypothetical protein
MEIHPREKVFLEDWKKILQGRDSPDHQQKPVDRKGYLITTLRMLTWLFFSVTLRK